MRMRKNMLLILTLIIIVSLSLAGCGYSTKSNASAGNSYPNQKVHKAQTSITNGEVSEIKKYYQSPMLENKDLPSVEKRLPKVPKLTNEMPEDELDYHIGRYGGTMNTVTSVVDWDADVFVMNNEPLINTPGIIGEKFTGNVLEGYEESPDHKTFTFHLRDGLKWSDGYPVTMKDFEFAINDVIFNNELTASFPAWLRSGNDPQGKPMTFKVVDPLTFKIAFDKPYPGFLIQLSVKGWRGYNDLLKPYHYLKKYHKKYADQEQLKAEMKKAGVTDWVQLFNKKDIINTELTHRDAQGFPVLNPWMVSKSTDTYTEYTRNPYYFKVDAAGNQLPYIDKIHSTYVQDMEMVNLDMVSGKADFARESAALSKMAMYKKGSKNSNFKVILAKMHLVPTTFYLNLTYKDPVWRKVAGNEKFRKALSLAIPRQEIIDTVYYGLADPSTLIKSDYDPKEANKLLDEMGMKKGKDGMRRAPDGSKFSFTFQIQPASPDFVPMTEIIVQEWRNLGIDVTMKQIDGALWSQRNAANSLQCSMMWIDVNRWYEGSWGQDKFGVLWNKWDTTDGKEGEKPPKDVQHLYDLVNKLYQVPPEEARTEVYQQIKDEVNKHNWFFSPIENVQQPVIVNKKLGNVTGKGYAIALNFSGEQLYYKK
ncbi:peptide/nickel transport system substrate-binding protein [Pullulanibacillus pueri]|uniref:Peptide ABC transporter substrate-binding protein n=1 Tax=Pullulanibacillus pueri TaxID=1437324 RepID=A0A8J2ZT69_9BACL|nr:ABC transporter substrate-binding protein [Pullulanibacillus pueri]MBM7680275.1 peptide/nickel transport system substrate-binding protein [Pullulanibacillus pueri]GGH75890.1 peptide ABC transporter substrate-binding protein [Pullulanibacillus pueri]